jgi:iron(III) transport system permease protein
MAIDATTAPARERFWPRLAHGNPWHLAVFIAVAAVVVIPLLLLVLGSFSLASLPTDVDLADLTIENYEEVWQDDGTLRVFTNTLIYVTGATALGISIAVALAWLVERTDMPGKVWIYAGVPMTLAVPSMLQAMAWVLLLSPRIGFLNSYLEGILGIGPFNIYSLGGMIFIEGLRLVPTAFLMLVPLLRSMDPTLEEAAAMSGASTFSSLRKVTARLMLPGLVAVVIYQVMTALEVFEVPGILGMPAGIYVFSTKIYSVLHTATLEPNYGEANALAIFYLGFAVIATFLYARVIARSERFTIITGKGYRPREFSLGRWRYVALGGAVLYLVLAVILPFLVFAFTSFMPYVRPPTAEAFAAITMRNYDQVFQTELIGKVLMNTLVLVVAASTLTVLVSFAVSYVVVRTQFRLRRVLDQLAFMPHAIPGIVMGLAFLWIFLNLDNWGIPIHGGLTAMTIAFAVSYMAYGTRSMNAAILQIHKDLEEAAHVSGAAKMRTLIRVFFPLMMPTFVGVWVWAMLHVIRTAGKPLILYEGEENQVLAILMWNMWDEGYLEAVAAIGTLLMAFLLLVTLGLRFVGFGRGTKLQGQVDT